MQVVSKLKLAGTKSDQRHEHSSNSKIWWLRWSNYKQKWWFSNSPPQQTVFCVIFSICSLKKQQCWSITFEQTRHQSLLLEVIVKKFQIRTATLLWYNWLIGWNDSQSQCCRVITPILKSLVEIGWSNKDFIIQF